MAIITMKPEDFNKVTNMFEFMDMAERSEYEEHLWWRLNKHIKLNQPFDQPIGNEYTHNDMVNKGYLKDHGNNDYTLTRKSLGLLWSVFGKTSWSWQN